jgi:hypothetical protein
METSQLPDPEIWWNFLSNAYNIFLLFFPELIIALAVGNIWYLILLKRNGKLAGERVLSTSGFLLSTGGLTGITVSETPRFPHPPFQFYCLVCIVGYVMVLVDLVDCWKSGDRWSKKIRQKYSLLGSSVSGFVFSTLSKAGLTSPNDKYQSLYVFLPLLIISLLLLIALIPDSQQDSTKV